MSPRRRLASKARWSCMSAAYRSTIDRGMPTVTETMVLLGVAIVLRRLRQRVRVLEEIVPLLQHPGLRAEPGSAVDGEGRMLVGAGLALGG
jgi:hypothetical protein